MLSWLIFAQLLQARHFIQSGKIRVGDIVDCGLADIHVACRFNNQLILELLLSQGLESVVLI